MPCTTCSARAGANGKVQLEATYTVPTGRCCNGETCTVTTQAACTGYYAGDGSQCAMGHTTPETEVDNQCADFGACCISGNCHLRNDDDCAGGTYISGPGKNWNACADPDPCVDPTGSCCRGSVCTVETESSCSDGVWTTAGTCSAGDCPQGTGSYFIG